MAKQKKAFKKGAWLFTLDEELTEEEFIRRAGGIEVINQFKGVPFVSLAHYEDGTYGLIGHKNGRTISLVMQSAGVSKYQTMEWK